MEFFKKLLNVIRPSSASNSKLEGEEDVISLTIAQDELECSAKKIANLISNNFSSRETAMQFVLEEFDLTQNGTDMEKIFIEHSGIEYHLYNDSITNFDQKNRIKFEEVSDACKQLSELLNIVKGSKSFKIKFKLAIVDKIMRKYNIGKYGIKESHENTITATKEA